MYAYTYDKLTGGIILVPSPATLSKEPRPVYYREMDLLGFDKHFDYEKNDDAPYMWAEANRYIYRGEVIASTSGGSCYHAPMLVITDAGEAVHTLERIDIEAMCRSNASIMDALVNETVRNVYNTYTKYRNRVDVFYVAFSGGKDSIVTLDIVSRALPHSEFKVMFGDTGMEFPDTYRTVDEVEAHCKKQGIEFLRAQSHLRSEESWRLFGPPARRVRWCCSVHKTAPIINKLCEIMGLEQMRSMMITGVRGDESVARSDYDEISLGKKLSGQYSSHPILRWSSAEVYTHIYNNDLLFNMLYKKGFNRVGCIMCPNSSEKHEYIKKTFYPMEVDKYCDMICETSKKDLSGGNRQLFIDIGGWKSRLSGRELKFEEDERYMFEETAGGFVFTIVDLNSDWITWYKTMGGLTAVHGGYVLEYNGVLRKCSVSTDGNKTVFAIENDVRTRNSIDFISLFRRVLTKAQYCIRCKTCVAECTNRCIIMNGDKFEISDDCVKCHGCLNVLCGCLYYNSIKRSKSVKKATGINRYLSVGINAQWIVNYMKDTTYEPGNRKSDVMFDFLGDAGIVSKKKFTDFGLFVKKHGLDDVNMWALMLCNLVYTKTFGWYIRNVPIYDTYTREKLDIELGNDITDKAKDEFWNGFKVILESNEAFRNIGVGIPDITIKTTKSGIRKTLNSLSRTPWAAPDPRVILYSLYKYSAACEGRVDFTLSRLMESDAESVGVSPAIIFGLDRDAMKGIITGLTANYGEYISSSFTHNLDNVNLREGRTAQDVLELF